MKIKSMIKKRPSVYCNTPACSPFYQPVSQLTICSSHLPAQSFSLPPRQARGELSYMGYIGMCDPKGYGFGHK